LDHIVERLQQGTAESAQPTLRALEGLGAQSVSDLAVLTDKDLLAAGISLVHARLILRGSAPSVQSAGASVQSAAPLQDPSNPADTILFAAASGLKRGERPAVAIFASAVLAGCFLSFGGMLFAQVAAGSPGVHKDNPGLHSLEAALVFPFGLVIIVFTQTC
jgi:hypothetical protein